MRINTLSNFDELHLLLISISLLAGKNLELFLTYQTLRSIKKSYRVEFIILSKDNMLRCHQRYWNQKYELNENYNWHRGMIWFINVVQARVYINLQGKNDSNIGMLTLLKIFYNIICALTNHTFVECWIKRLTREKNMYKIR